MSGLLPNNTNLYWYDPWEAFLNTFEIRRLLRLARANGWKPMGTIPPDGWEGNWDTMDYVSLEGQKVEESDAIGIAKALERFLEILDLIPFHDVGSKGFFQVFYREIDKIKSFARFCRDSKGFAIH